MAWEETAMEIGLATWNRFIELVMVPISNEEIRWAALPLAIATVFMTLYFGKHRTEELGWNTAFGNAMVFMFVALNLIKQLYYEQGAGSWSYLLSNNLYLTITVGLVGASTILMTMTYFHLLPQRLAFFIFSTIPINVSVYVIMTVVYANMPSDYLTVLAAVVLLVALFIIAKIIQLFERTLGATEGAPDKTQKHIDELEEKLEEEEEEELLKKPKHK